MHQDLAEVDLPEQGFRVQFRTWRALLDRPLTSYYLVLGITLLLLGLGLVMVQSTASVADLTAGLSPYSDFKKQLLGACVGLPLMWVAARSSPRLFRALAYPLLAVAVVGLCLTLIHGVGVTQNGASRWINIGGQQVQPSEIAKLALAMSAITALQFLTSRCSSPMFTMPFPALASARKSRPPGPSPRFRSVRPSSRTMWSAWKTARS